MNWIFLIKGILCGIAILTGLRFIAKFKTQGVVSLFYESLIIAITIPIIIFL